MRGRARDVHPIEGAGKFEEFRPKPPRSTMSRAAFPDYAFLDRMSIVFVTLVLLMFIIGLADPRTKNNPKGLEIDVQSFRTSPAFVLGSVIILGILAALYTVFW